MVLRHKKKVFWNSEGKNKLSTAEFRVSFELQAFYSYDIAKVACKGFKRVIFLKMKKQNLLYLPINNSRLCSSVALIHLDSSNNSLSLDF